MLILKFFGKGLNQIFDRIFAVSGAALFSQIPALISQYINALSGALMESSKQIDSLKIQAKMSGLSLSEFISRHLHSSDSAFRASGRLHQEALVRFQEYKTAFSSLNDSTVWTKPFIFIRYLDFDLLKAVKFTPSLPLTIEGLIYAIAGILFGLLVYHLLVKQFFSIPYRIWKK